MDGLAHLAQNGKLYNGYDASKITPQGFEELGIEAFSGGIISKGVLIDIPLLYGKEYLGKSDKCFRSLGAYPLSQNQHPTGHPKSLIKEQLRPTWYPSP